MPNTSLVAGQPAGTVKGMLPPLGITAPVGVVREPETASVVEISVNCWPTIGATQALGAPSRDCRWALPRSTEPVAVRALSEVGVFMRKDRPVAASNDAPPLTASVLAAVLAVSPEKPASM